MAKAKREIKLKLEFTESDLNQILEAANFGDGKPWTVAELTGAQFKDLKEELVATAPNFVVEIIDGSRDACANDWLNQFDRYFDEDDD